VTESEYLKVSLILIVNLKLQLSRS